MDIEELLKYSAVTFLLTGIFYSRPICTSLQSGISCTMHNSASVFSPYIYEKDYAIFFLITLFTAIIFFRYAAMRNKNNIANSELTYILLYMTSWFGLISYFSKIGVSTYPLPTIANMLKSSDNALIVLFIFITSVLSSFSIIKYNNKRNLEKAKPVSTIVLIPVMIVFGISIITIYKLSFVDYSPIDLPVVILISALTSFSFVYLKGEEIFPLSGIKNENLRILILYLIVWISIMTIFLGPYYYYESQILPPSPIG